MSLKAGILTHLPWRLAATELAAGTAFEIVSPVDGYIENIRGIVQVAIVTGGAITVEIATVAVTGLGLTVADSATKGTVYSDDATAGTATRYVSKGSRITITPAAAFNGGGALDGFLAIRSIDVSPAL